MQAFKKATTTYRSKPIQKVNQNMLPFQATQKNKTTYTVKKIKCIQNHPNMRAA